jgi:hypothetical protein
MTDILTAALDYAAHGLPVFPCKRTDKSPLTKHGYKDATTDPDQIRGWWKKWPAAMIGMPTGVIDVVDLDVKKGKNGFTAVPDWADRSPVIVRTPSDPSVHTDGAPDEGAHLWFKSNGTVKLGTDVNSLGVDIRCKGGYVIVPPSMNGFGAYRFEKGGLDQIAQLPTFPADLAARDKDDGDTGPHTSATEFTADLFRIKAAVEVIPNDDLSREEWNNIGMAIWRASGGAKAGLDIFYRFSKKSDKHHNRKTVTDRWQHYFRSPPNRIGFGTLWHLATIADPSWEDRAVDQIEQRLNHPTLDLDWERKFLECIEKQADVSVLVPQRPPMATTATEPEAAPEPKPTTSIEPDAGALIITSRKLVSNFKPPDYLIEGLLQRRFLYGLTAQTNAGKTTVALRLALHVAFGLPLGDREIEQGKVLFFAGENPDDVTMRWIKLCEETNTDPETDQVFWVSGIYSIKKLRKVIDTQTKKCGPFALVVIDSAAAYFEGDEENSNTQLGAYARMLRTLVEIYGGPTILVICHPVKNADPDNLVPRGGSAFVNEIDGNLVLKIISEAPKVVDLHWQVKFRGPDFAPIPFALTPGYSKKIKDSKGREISTITAKPLSAVERATAEDQGQGNQDRLLDAMKYHNGSSLIELAKLCGWFYKSGDPNKSLVNRTMHDLEARRLVKKEGGRWKLTKAGLAVDTESLSL